MKRSPLLALALLAAAVPAASAQTPAPAATAAAPSAADPAARQMVDTVNAAFKTAFDRGDAAALAALCTPDARFVGVDGTAVQGTEAVKKQYADFFTANPKATVAIQVESVRNVTPDVVQEEGSATITPAEGEPSVSRYTCLHVRKDGKWLQAEIRDLPSPAPADSAAADVEFVNPIAQLDWMIGEWVDESPDAVITHTCRYVLGGKFILREYTARRGDEPTSEGFHLIGYDPQTGLIKSWGFDAEGSHGEATWSTDGEKWVVKMTGVLADGRAVSATQLIGPVNNNSIRMSAVDRTIDGQIAPDREEVVLVRKPAAPAVDATEPAATPAPAATPTPAAAPAAAPAPTTAPAPAAAPGTPRAGF